MPLLSVKPPSTNLGTKTLCHLQTFRKSVVQLLWCSSAADGWCSREKDVENSLSDPCDQLGGLIKENEAMKKQLNYLSNYTWSSLIASTKHTQTASWGQANTTSDSDAQLQSTQIGAASCQPPQGADCVLRQVDSLFSNVSPEVRTGSGHRQYRQMLGVLSSAGGGKWGEEK